MIISTSMKRNFLATFVFFSFIGLLCPGQVLALPEIASFTSVKGEVRIKSSVRADGKWLRVKKTGVLLYSGDEIRTIAGNAEITFDDGSVMKVSEDTSFTLEERPTRRKLFGFIDTSFMNRNVKVGFGKLWANIKKARGKWTSFESKVAVAGIKGTSISMYVDSRGDLQFACHEGVAALTKTDGSFEFNLESGKEVWIKSKERGKTLIESVKGELGIESKNGSIGLEDKGSVLIGESAEGTSVAVPGSEEGIVGVSTDSLNVRLDAGDEIVIGKDELAGETSVTTVRSSSGYIEVGAGDVAAMLDAGDVFAVSVNRVQGTVTLTVLAGSVEVTRDGQTTEMGAGDSMTDDIDIIMTDQEGGESEAETFISIDPVIEPLPVEEDSSSSVFVL